MKRYKKKVVKKKKETMVNRIQKDLKGTEKIFFEFFFDNCLRSKKVVLSFFFFFFFFLFFFLFFFFFFFFFGFFYGFFFVFFFFDLIKKSFKNLEMMT